MKSSNLLSAKWMNLDSYELTLLLDKRIGGPGQYQDRVANPQKLYLPLGGASCRISVTFRGDKIVTIEPGPAFDEAEWEAIGEEIENSILAGSLKVGRQYTFSTLRVMGSWHGERSGVQILPVPSDAPRAKVEIADHPFILEFPINASDFVPITNYRLTSEHRKLTLLLNVLLAGRMSLPPLRPGSFWAEVPGNCWPNIQWVQESFHAKLGEPLIDKLSHPTDIRLDEVESQGYFSKVGHDGKGLRVPDDLDESICLYFQLSAGNRVKFDRATFWMDMASRQWTISVSASFASLVSSVESLTEKGATHQVYCEMCKRESQHLFPGSTESFRGFFETYAPGLALKKRRDQMYSLRSGILHGSELMKLDQDRAFGWHPPWWNEYELHRELWTLMVDALHNWLRNPPGE